MKPWVGNAVLLIASGLICLLATEVFIRVVAPRDLSGIPIIYSDKGLIVNKESGSVRHELGDRLVRYDFYPLHIRGSQIDRSKAQILVVGESFTFGWLLPYSSTYVGILQQYAEQEFPGTFKFLNAAARGWGTADYMAFIEDYGASISPGMVLVFLNTDDIGRSVNSDIYRLLSEDSMRLRRQEVEVPFWATLNLPLSETLRENSHAWNLLRSAVHKFIELVKPSGGNADDSDIYAPTTFLQDEAAAREAVRLGRALFLRLQAWCERHGAELVVVTTGWHEPPYDSDLNEATRAFMAQAADFFAENDISYFDASYLVAPVRTKDPDHFSIPGDGHPNEIGARMIADCNWPFIREELHELLEHQPRAIAAAPSAGKTALAPQDSTCPPSTDTAALR